MKKWMTSTTIAAMTALTLSAPVDAARMGSGRSVGKQSPSVMQRDATPATPNAVPPTSAAQPSAAMRQPAAGAAQAAQQSARSRWMAPLAGIAAGLGLAWLASQLGFGEELATMLLIGLALMAALVLWRVLRARRAASGPQPAFAGQGAARSSVDVTPAATPYSAAPGAAAGSAAALGGAAAASARPTAGKVAVPAGFDADAFVRNAKQQFVRLQATFDAGNLAELQEFTSPQMFDELKTEIAQRGATRNVTEVITLGAQLLNVETEAGEYVASVRFSGLIREQENAQPEPFDEIWNLTKPVSGNQGWVLAGIQQAA